MQEKAVKDRLQDQLAKVRAEIEFKNTSLLELEVTIRELKQNTVPQSSQEMDKLNEENVHILNENDSLQAQLNIFTKQKDSYVCH